MRFFIEDRDTYINNKEKFMKSPSDPYTLLSRDLPIIREHYSNKFNIRIIINGETEFGKKSILSLREEEMLIFSKLEDDQSKYSVFLIAQWELKTNMLKNGYEYPFSFSEKYPKFKDYISQIYLLLSNNNFLDCNGLLRQLNNIEKISLNELIRNSEFKFLFDESIICYQKEFKKILENKGLSRESIPREIEFIQKELKENEIVGYFFTNGNVLDQDHFEVLIITSSKIIKPINWGKQVNQSGIKKALDTEDITDLYFTNTQDFILKEGWKSLEKQPLAQAGVDECGTLGLMYLKELLKNDSYQLNNYCKIFAFYNEKGEVVNFFLPSPHVLRYSQSSFYNKVIEAILANDEQTILTHKDKSYSVRTLYSILQKSIVIAETKKDSVMIKQNKQLLNELEYFSEKWLKEYKNSSKKRAEMDNDGTNFYLSYATQRMKKHVSLEDNNDGDEIELIISLPECETTESEYNDIEEKESQVSNEGLMKF
ncbi:MAG: hypothetical protein QM652_04045 [Legionella sp.]|uniref:hypothetical protein n=1 Tax=Legionella sp. TaxID=459 RepID=UPI0039E6244D